MSSICWIQSVLKRWNISVQNIKKTTWKVIGSRFVAQNIFYYFLDSGVSEQDLQVY